MSPSAAPTRRRGRTGFVSNPKASLREQVHEVMRFFHYSGRTEATYWQWIERYLRFHKRPGVSGASAWRHPRELGAADAHAFLSHLASEAPALPTRAGGG